MSTPQTLTLRMGSASRDCEEQFALPPGWAAELANPRDRAALTAEQEAKAIREPLGIEPIAAGARGARKVALLLDDFRRPTPVERLSRLVLGELAEAGVSPRQVTILLGNGAHRVMNTREIRKRLGTLCDEVGEVVSHDAYSNRVHYCGVTSSGTPVLVNEAARADYSISISMIYPHRLTAWAGGAKMVLPGIAHVSTIHFHHSRLSGGPWGGPPAQNASRRDLEEAARLYGLNVSLCSVINSRKELCGLYAGEPTKAHRAAIALAKRVGDTPVCNAHPDLVIANGYPLDGDATQYSKVQAPALAFDCPLLMLSDFADPSIYHGLYHGPPAQYRKRPPLQPQERTEALLMKAPVFFYSPQYGKGFVPPDKSWYCEDNWERLMAAMACRWPQAQVLVFPVAPLQLPRLA